MSSDAVTSLTFAQGETFRRSMSAPEGVDFDDGWSFAAVVRATRSSAADAVLDLEPSVVDGEMVIVKDTADLPVGGYFWDLRATSPAGDDYVSPVWRLFIRESVTGVNEDSTPS